MLRTDTQRLAESHLRRLVHRFIRQSTGPRHDAWTHINTGVYLFLRESFVLKAVLCGVKLTDSSFLVNVSRHDPDLTLSRL